MVWTVINCFDMLSLPLHLKPQGLRQGKASFSPHDRGNDLGKCKCDFRPIRYSLSPVDSIENFAGNLGSSLLL